MRRSKLLLIVLVAISFVPSITFGQRVGFINSAIIRKNYTDAQQAEKRVESMTQEWKREISAQQQEIDNMEFEINKNRLIWTDAERAQKEKELADKKSKAKAFSRSIFEPGGKYDDAVKRIMSPVEEKIFASVQQVSADKGFDIILDINSQPVPYVNYKYDLTVEVLKTLGVDVDKLEQELKEKIEKDPRNEKRESKTPRRRSRSLNDPDNPAPDNPDLKNQDEKNPPREFVPNKIPNKTNKPESNPENPETK